MAVARMLDVRSDKELQALDEAFLDENGRIKLLPAEAYTSVDQELFWFWCHKRARYIIPTVELVTYLKERIRNRKAIEVGAGNADLGYHLGIKMTDSRIQERHPEMRMIYKLKQQATTSPPPDVITADAITAINRFRPDVVVAAWLSRKFMPGTDGPGSDAFVHGPEEETIIRKTRMYIHVGNAAVHGTKTALKIPHEEVYIPGHVSRAWDQSKNVIYVWGK